MSGSGITDQFFPAWCLCHGTQKMMLSSYALSDYSYTATVKNVSEADGERNL